MKTPPVRIKRVYEEAAEADGFRVFVDRLWPRGVSKDAFHYDLWCKDLAPSPALRTWFGHKPEHWDGFREGYASELHEAACQRAMGEVFAAAKGRPITLVYGARDPEHNHALILAEEMSAYARRHKT
ncbi:DUF488 domain-containing protein [Castellaniella sp. S9]|uniref:DUF488 domain-containing protein n=1 Tax=Castellaniella sp. S9 TaxID=2993652 RepID=UPI0022B505CE|nr:DUF488 family protein [Castellaniella sp. S9]